MLHCIQEPGQKEQQTDDNNNGTLGNRKKSIRRPVSIKPPGMNKLSRKKEKKVNLQCRTSFDQKMVPEGQQHK
jgi:hypothetical protein